jgi:hypothetical protein
VLETLVRGLEAVEQHAFGRGMAEEIKKKASEALV